MSTQEQPRGRPAVPAHRPPRTSCCARSSADELERLDDERLELLTVTAVDGRGRPRAAPRCSSTRSAGERRRRRGPRGPRRAARGSSSVAIGRRGPPEAHARAPLRSDRRRPGAHRRAAGRHPRTDRTVEPDLHAAGHRGRRARGRRGRGAGDDDGSSGPRREPRRAGRPRRARRGRQAGGLDVATTSWPSPAACSAPARSATPARSTPTPPACCCSVWVGSPGCCASSPPCPRPTPATSCSGWRPPRSTPPAR